MLRVNEANEGFNKIKWSSSPSEWKNEWIRLTMKTSKKEKHTNGFANNASWMVNDEGWMTNDEYEWWVTNDEWRMMKDEQMMKDEGWMTNDERWMTNAERWIQSLLHDNYNNAWIYLRISYLSARILVKKTKKFKF